MSIDTPYVRGAERLKLRLERIRASIDVQATTQDIGALLLRRTLERFDREVDPDNRKWAELSEETVMTRRRKGRSANKKKLVETGAMRRAIKLIRGGLGTIFTNTGAGVRIGIEDPEIAEYARAQQRGTDNIPARRFLGIGALDVKSVDAYMRRKAKKMESV
jgi:phage gpG-like protein